MNIVLASQLFAIEHHGGDKNKHDGEIYLKHVARVAFSVVDDAMDNGMSDHTIGILESTAWLHDVIEDTSASFTILKNYLSWAKDGSYPWESVSMILNAVDLLTKRGDSNEDYYHRIAEDSVAKFVKIRDMRDNFRRNHMIEDEATRARMAKKYSLGMDILGGQ